MPCRLPRCRRAPHDRSSPRRRPRGSPGRRMRRAPAGAPRGPDAPTWGTSPAPKTRRTRGGPSRPARRRGSSPATSRSVPTPTARARRRRGRRSAAPGRRRRPRRHRGNRVDHHDGMSWFSTKNEKTSFGVACARFTSGSPRPRARGTRGRAPSRARTPDVTGSRAPASRARASRANRRRATGRTRPPPPPTTGQ